MNMAHGPWTIPTDFHIFQRGRYTTNQIWFDDFVYLLSMVIFLAAQEAMEFQG